MKVYGHLQGYLHRWRVGGFGPFMMRIHQILDIDRTPFLHTHPFSYLSIVWRGGYTEQVLQKDGSLKTIKHGRFSIIMRSYKTAHRISAVEHGTMTLFFTWDAALVGQGWRLMRHPKLKAPEGYHDAPDGVHVFPDGFRKRKNGMWYVMCKTPQQARLSTKLSIHQNLDVGSVTEPVDFRMAA